MFRGGAPRSTFYVTDLVLVPPDSELSLYGLMALIWPWQPYMALGPYLASGGLMATYSLLEVPFKTNMGTPNKQNRKLGPRALKGP